MIWAYYKKRLDDSKLNKLNKERVGLILKLAVAVKKHQPRNHIRKELTLVTAQIMELA